MRVVLVLCLLAFMSCQKDIMDIAKCLYENPKVKELIEDAMVAIVTKDFSKLLPKIIESLPELIQTVIKCVSAEIKDINLQGLDEYCQCRLKCLEIKDSTQIIDCLTKCWENKFY